MYRYRIAIVGPADSISLIGTVAQEYREQFETVPIVYQDASETAGILTDKRHEADAWLFSGRVPYSYAVAGGLDGKVLLHIPHTGSSLLRIFFQMSVDGTPFHAISFDTLSHKDIGDIFADIAMPLPRIYVEGVEGIVSAQEMFNFHYSLWREGKIGAAITGFLETYLLLREKGVPVYRLAPTRDNIHVMFNHALQILKTNYFKESQIAIHHILIDQYEEFVRESQSVYHVKRIERQLYSILLDYTEEIKGSIVEYGNGRFTIYSTRGSVSGATNSHTVMPILEELSVRLPFSVSGGIGFGPTAYDADRNAHTALSIALRRGKCNWMIVTDEHAVIGPLNSATRLEYSIRSGDESYNKLAIRLNISIATVNKMFAAFKKIDKDRLSVDELALHLSITPRSARRLLGAMVKEGFAEVVGEELVNGVGRPRKLYRVLVQQIIGNYEN